MSKLNFIIVFTMLTSCQLKNHSTVDTTYDFKKIYRSSYLAKRSEFQLDKNITGITVRLHFEELGGVIGHTYFIQVNCDNPNLNTGNLNICDFNSYSKITKNARFLSKGIGIRLNDTDNKMILFKDLLEFIEKKEILSLEGETNSKYFGDQGFFVLEFLSNGKYQEVFWQPTSPDDNFWTILEKIRTIVSEIDTLH